MLKCIEIALFCECIEPDVKKSLSLLYTYKFFLKTKQKKYNWAKELYYDATIFFFILHCLLAKKNGNWKMVQGCRLSPTIP